MSDYLTVELISDRFRHAYPEIAGETFAVVLHSGRAAMVLGTDEDVHHMDPIHWATDQAAHLDVSFQSPPERVGFAFDRARERWYGYDADAMAADDRKIGPAWDATPVVRGVIGSRRAAA